MEKKSKKNNSIELSTARLPFLTVVIKTDEYIEYLHDCLHSVMQCEYPKNMLEIFLVGSKYPEEVKQAQNSVLHEGGQIPIWVIEDKDAEIAAGRIYFNKRGNIVVTMDAGCAITPNSFVRIANLFANKPNVQTIMGLELPDMEAIRGEGDLLKKLHYRFEFTDTVIRFLWEKKKNRFYASYALPGVEHDKEMIRDYSVMVSVVPDIRKKGKTEWTLVTLFLACIFMLLWVRLLAGRMATLIMAGVFYLAFAVWMMVKYGLAVIRLERNGVRNGFMREQFFCATLVPFYDTAIGLKEMYNGTRFAMEEKSAEHKGFFVRRLLKMILEEG